MMPEWITLERERDTTLECERTAMVRQEGMTTVKFERTTEPERDLAITARRVRGTTGEIPRDPTRAVDRAASRSRRRALVVALASLALSACSILPSKPARTPPPLADMEEPLALAAEPDDEAQRAGLERGSFTGIVPGDARASLEEMMSDPSGVLVASVVENSPADIAGVLPGDILVSADTGGEKHALKWPSEWRAIELAATAGTAIDVEIDRAEEQRRAHIVTVARVHTPARDAATKLREEQRAGIVVRAATEVEARAAGLGPGGGAVVVGLSQTSPWRRDGIRFGDLVRSVNGTPVAHPEVLLEAIRAAPSDGELDLEIVRAGSVETVVAHLTRRESEIKHITIPILFSYDKNRGQTEWSFLFGLLSRESNAAAWRMSFLWFFSFSGGDADRLEVLRS